MRLRAKSIRAYRCLLFQFKSVANGLSHLAHFKRQDLWKANYSGFDNVVVFGVEEMVSMILTQSC